MATPESLLGLESCIPPDVLRHPELYLYSLHCSSFFLLLVPSKIRNTNLLTPKTELQWRPQVDPENLNAKVESG